MDTNQEEDKLAGTADLIKINAELRSEIHERREAEKALREALARLEALVDNLQQGVVFEDQTRRICSANRKFCDLFGIPSPEAIVGADCAALAEQAKAYFSDPEDFVGTIARRLAEQRIVLAEELTLTDGRIFERDYIPVATDQVPQGNYWIYRDITKRKRREERLRGVNAGLLKMGYDHGANLHTLTTLCGELLEADCALYNRLDGNLLCVRGQWQAPADLKNEDAPLGHICFDVIKRDKYQPLVIRHLQNTGYARSDPNVAAYGLSTYVGHPVRFGETIRGSLCAVYTRDYEPGSDALDIIGIIAAAIAQEEERASAAAALRQSGEFIWSVLDNVDEGFLVMDRDYRVVTANDAFCRWVDRPFDQVIGGTCYELIHKKSRPCHEDGQVCVVKSVFESGKPSRVEYRRENVHGATMYAEHKAFPLRDASGNISLVIETIHDVTARHLLETERLKTQKLEAVGTLAGGIAHDFNNLLQGLFGYLSMAKVGLGRNEKALAMLEQAEKALTMSVNLTTQLLTFAKGGRPVKKRISLRPVLENATKFALSGSRSDYHLRIAENLRSVEADEGQIGQVIQNIVLNASEAMPGGGTVVISAENTDIPSGSNPLVPEGGRFVRIAIEDRGIGIAAKYLPKIFDPYFTTKQKGSGLGLATSYSIIRSHGGMIDVESKADQGSTFFICLPACTPEEERPQAPAMEVGRPLQILVMDDEEMIRAVVTEMLAALGHRVEAARDGEEAIAIFLQAREEGRPFDALILDLTVKGGMGGEETLKKLREIDPAVVAIVSSGYADNPVVADYRSYGFMASLRKPYEIGALNDCLKVLLRQ